MAAESQDSEKSAETRRPVTKSTGKKDGAKTAQQLEESVLLTLIATHEAYIGHLKGLSKTAFDWSDARLAIRHHTIAQPNERVCNKSRYGGYPYRMGTEADIPACRCCSADLAFIMQVDLDWLDRTAALCDPAVDTAIGLLGGHTPPVFKLDGVQFTEPCDAKPDEMNDSRRLLQVFLCPDYNTKAHASYERHEFSCIQVVPAPAYDHVYMLKSRPAPSHPNRLITQLFAFPDFPDMPIRHGATCRQISDGRAAQVRKFYPYISLACDGVKQAKRAKDRRIKPTVDCYLGPFDRLLGYPDWPQPSTLLPDAPVDGMPSCRQCGKVTDIPIAQIYHMNAAVCDDRAFTLGVFQCGECRCFALSWYPLRSSSGAARAAQAKAVTDVDAGDVGKGAVCGAASPANDDDGDDVIDLD